MWLRRIALALALLGAALLVVSGFGVRAGLWPYGIGIRIFAAVMFVGAGAALLAIIALSLRRFRARSAWIALAVGVVSAAVPLYFLAQARSVPPIHDITTDTEKPPQFVVNPSDYDPRVGEVQKEAYPRIRPLELGVPPAAAFARALAAAREMGWEVVAAEEKEGRIEAVATTRWFGFKDDVVVRLTPAAGGARIDVRSKSRVGRSDVGANARRIERFLMLLTTQR
jgi:uncharacterized protein (DUF1499 family)